MRRGATDGGRPTQPPHDVDREAGQVGGAEVLPVAVLVFVVGGLLLVNAWAVVDAKLAASAAAREAARTYAEVSPGLDGATGGGAALAAARDVFAAYGIPASRTAVRATESPGSQRCAPVAIETTVTVPAITVPWVGGFGDGIVVHGRARTIVDPWRSGLDGAGCG